MEDKQMAVGACVEFLDLQLADAKDELERVRKQLIDAGIAESTVKAGSKAVAKEVEGDQIGLFYALLAAEKYMAFTMKRRDYKYIQLKALERHLKTPKRVKI